MPQEDKSHWLHPLLLSDTDVIAWVMLHDVNFHSPPFLSLSSCSGGAVPLHSLPHDLFGLGMGHRGEFLAITCRPARLLTSCNDPNYLWMLGFHGVPAQKEHATLHVCVVSQDLVLDYCNYLSFILA